MQTLIAALKAKRRNVRVLVAAGLTAGAVGGWAMSTMPATSAASIDTAPRFDRNLSLEDSKPALIGSYTVTGTDPDGKPYAGTGIVDIALAPSGALELEWDNGKQVGIGQVTGNVLAVACLTKGRTSILIMNINPDGSLSGRWSRRLDRGYKGTETWKRT